jgi:hypothetical protein
MTLAADAFTDRVDRLIDEFDRTEFPWRLAGLAEALGDSGDARAVNSLLTGLTRPAVQDHGFVEQACCEALVELGVMRRSPTGWYALLRAHELAPQHVCTVRELDGAIPLRYLLPIRHAREYPARKPVESPKPCRHGNRGECPYCREHP